MQFIILRNKNGFCIIQTLSLIHIYLNSSDPKELALHCMEDIDKDFVKNVKAGDIMVANKNFGCGSSREHAPIAIKAAGVSCVIEIGRAHV